MTTFILGVLIFSAGIFLMVAMTLVRGKPLEGSCGGIGRMFGYDGCIFCSKRRRGECPVKKG